MNRRIEKYICLEFFKDLRMALCILFPFDEKNTLQSLIWKHKTVTKILPFWSQNVIV